MPSEEERLGILKIHLKNKLHKVSNEVLNNISKNSNNLSGADIENIVNEAGYICV